MVWPGLVRTETLRLPTFARKAPAFQYILSVSWAYLVREVLTQNVQQQSVT